MSIDMEVIIGGEISEAYERGRRKGLEEAATIADECNSEHSRVSHNEAYGARMVAKAIRRLLVLTP